MNLANLVQVHRFRLAGVVLAGALSLVPFSFHSERELETATRIEGSEAEGVAQELSTRFHSPFVNQVILAVQGIPPADSAEGAKALSAIEEGLRNQPGVLGIVSHLDMDDPLFVGKNGGTLLILGLGVNGGSVEALIPKLRERTKSLENNLRRAYPSVKMELTGETPLNFDIRKASADDVQHGETLAIPATFALLFLAFGSLVASLIPLSVGQLAIAATMAIALFLGTRLHLSILIQSLAAMLGLGLGIDYALLMVSRFREALAAGQNSIDAALIAARQAGHTLLISASTVAIGFLALLTVPISEVRSIGIAGFLVAGISVLLANTVVPATLALLGTRVDFGRLSFRGRLEGQHVAPAGRRWRQWGQRIVAHPWMGIVIAGVPLLVLALQSARLDTRLPRGNWLPPAAESVQALDTLGQMGRAGIVQSLRVILELPGASIAETNSSWRALTKVSDHLAADARCGRMISLTTLTKDDRSLLDGMSSETRRTFLSADGRATLLEVLPTPDVTPREQVKWVRELRRADAASIAGISGAYLRIGGIPALNADYQSIVGEHLVPVITLVLGATFLALMLGFRSLFAALKAIALNLLSVAAAFGALVLVFQEGHGIGLMGLREGTGSVFPIVPILAFALVFGLSMDYEVFLVARVREARQSGFNEMDAIPQGMAKTAGLITSAAAIMIVVFGAFTFGHFLVVKMLGFTLAVAVLIDATLIRIVIGPALLSIAGDWNWWPGGVAIVNSKVAVGRSK